MFVIQDATGNYLRRNGRWNPIILPESIFQDTEAVKLLRAHPACMALAVFILPDYRPEKLRAHPDFRTNIAEAA